MGKKETKMFICSSQTYNFLYLKKKKSFSLIDFLMFSISLHYTLQENRQTNPHI